MNIIKRVRYSCFVFGEGGKDKKFLRTLIDLEKFRFHTKKWTFNYGNASGGSAKSILEKCHKEVSGYDYHLILCFIDLDDLKHDFPRTWKNEKRELEEKYCNFKIIWQLNNSEDEIKKVLGNMDVSKNMLNKIAKEKIKKFINSDFWKRILEPIKTKEKELDQKEE